MAMDFNSEYTMVVKVAKLNGSGDGVKDIEVPANATVGAVLAKAGYEATGFDLRVNNLSTSGADILLKDGDVITLVPAIKGGC